jgi:hypothetical protein
MAEELESVMVVWSRIQFGNSQLIVAKKISHFKFDFKSSLLHKVDIRSR